MQMPSPITATTDPGNFRPEPTAAQQQATDFDTFLKMLTAQIQNQDPLNPIDSTDYATQLATFSGVEQQVRTNELLAAFSQQFGSSGLAELAGWVGMEARVAAPASFDGTPITIYPKPSPDAGSVFLTVTNAAGQEVLRQQITSGNQPIDWAGVDDTGQPLPPGAYTFNTESFVNGELTSTDQAEIYSLVSEAKSMGGEMLLVLQGGTEVTSDSITALRTPEI